MKKLLIAAMMLVCFDVNARDPAQVREFRRTHSCPSTHKFVGACSTHVVDHIIPLCAGGKDAPSNMTWEEKQESYLKDQDERKLCAWIDKSKARQIPTRLKNGNN